MQKLEPDLEIEVDIWRKGDSFGKLSLGLGLNEKRQLLFYLGKVVSDTEPAWWLIAERHVELLYFFLDHKIFFDDQLDKSGKRYRQRGGRLTYEIHFESDSYEAFLKLLRAKIDHEPGKADAWISSRKMYSLVGILSLILDFMDSDAVLSQEEFEDKLDHFLDILEEEAFNH